MPGRITKEDIEKVRAAADLYDIVSADVTLKPSGSGTFMGLCPFHDEKTGSFSVRPSLGAWHCFGCGLGGDVFGYVEQRESVGFAEAVEILADKYNIELHYEREQTKEKQGSRRSRLLQACEEAQRFFTAQLLTKEALPARKMLAGRTFTQADAQRFGCGYAPQGWDNLVRHLAGKGFTHQEMIDAGLARQGQRGAYDYFRGRVTWPIRDTTGRTIGFGARKLYDDDTIQAKYINTPDTALYQKNRVLYGIDLAKRNIVAKRQVVIVEGYTDVMAMHLAGVDTAVATCGTAFGAEHAKIVRRLIKDDALGGIQIVGGRGRVVFTFDGDEAGQKAALHAFGLDGSFLTQTFVAVAPGNLDPCDLRITQGDAAVRNLIAGAKPLYDFVIDAALARFDLQYTTARVGAMKATVPIIARIRDTSLVDEYTRQTAGKIGIDAAEMRREVQFERRRQHVYDEDAFAPRDRGRSFDYGQSYGQSYGQPGRGDAAMMRRERQEVERANAANQTYFSVDDAVFSCEQQLMGVLVQMPGAVPDELFAMLASLGDQVFEVPAFRSLFDALVLAGPKPAEGQRRELWLHGLAEAAGPLLEQVINQLSVMPLPLPVEERKGRRPVEEGGVERGRNGRPLEAGLDENGHPTEASVQYASELAARLVDLALMRRISAAKQCMNATSDANTQMAMLRELTDLETRRRNLQARYFHTNAA